MKMNRIKSDRVQRPFKTLENLAKKGTTGRITMSTFFPNRLGETEKLFRGSANAVINDATNLAPALSRADRA